MKLDCSVQLVSLATKEMAETYCRLATIRSGREYVPCTNPKWVVHFEKAAQQCAEAGLSPMEWCEFIFDGYSDIGGETIIPYPNQLHGEVADLHVRDRRPQPPGLPRPKYAGWDETDYAMAEDME